MTPDHLGLHTLTPADHDRVLGDDEALQRQWDAPMSWWLVVPLCLVLAMLNEWWSRWRQRKP